MKRIKNNWTERTYKYLRLQKQDFLDIDDLINNCGSMLTEIEARFINDSDRYSIAGFEELFSKSNKIRSFEISIKNEDDSCFDYVKISSSRSYVLDLIYYSSHAKETELSGLYISIQSLLAKKENDLWIKTLSYMNFTGRNILPLATILLLALALDAKTKYPFWAVYMTLTSLYCIIELIPILLKTGTRRANKTLKSENNPTIEKIKAEAPVILLWALLGAIVAEVLRILVELLKNYFTK
ncbi:hypothetical protein CSA80_03005 [Candidatus Saccharibacteria bacterium]|nr:MAG: hypothetical protein CSA80_03005 [Candidatus Saccharibacteria bacterium]